MILAKLRRRRALDREFFADLDRMHEQDAAIAEADDVLGLGPLTHDFCAVCDKPLHVSERVEVMIGASEFDTEFGGSFATLATYCTDHAPEDQ